MNSISGAIFYALLMIVAGFGIPIMAALNGNLGTKLHNPLLATTVLFIVGGVSSFVYMVLSGGTPKLTSQEPIPFYFYMGGLLVAFYIFSITWVAPKFGLGNAISFVLLGQLISMTIIDNYSLLGAQQHPLSLARTLGLIFMVLGVFLTVRRF